MSLTAQGQKTHILKMCILDFLQYFHLGRGRYGAILEMRSDPHLDFETRIDNYHFGNSVLIKQIV